VGALPPPPPAGALPLHPAKGLCPLETQSGALPPIPPQGPLALDPSPQALTGLGDYLLWGLSFVYCWDEQQRRGLRRGPGGDRKAPLVAPAKGRCRYKHRNGTIFCARWSFALTGDQRAFRSPFGNLRRPSGWRGIRMFAGGTVFFCYLLKIVGRGAAEGVQGAIGKPPGCCGGNVQQVSD